MPVDVRPPLVALMGPTASGKTALAVEWSRCRNMAIVSVDSALVYRGLDVGSAKPDAVTLALAPHRLIDIREPHQIYSAADFRTDALREILDIVRSGKTPLLVGGTGLYFRAVLDGLSAMPPADERLRAEIEAEAMRRGWAAMHGELAKVDAPAAARIAPADAQRIQRALEVFHATGKPISQWQRESQRTPLPYRVLRLVVAPSERHVLHERIAQRFAAMLDAGLIEEVRRLHADPRLSPDLPSMRAVGYRQAWEWLERGNNDLSILRAMGIHATRQLAKRQLTWLRGELSARWFDPERQRGEVETALDLFLGTAS